MLVRAAALAVALIAVAGPAGAWLVPPLCTPDICVCREGSTCAGRECVLAVPETGGDNMEQREGLSRGWETTFPRSCSTCRCVRDNFPLPAISFEQCERRLGGPAAARTAARRLRDLSWLHFPKCGTSFGLVVENYGCIPSEDGEAGAGASTAATADDAGTDKTTAAAEATARVYNIHTQKVERHHLSGECACSEPKHWDQLLRARRKQALTCAPDVTLHGPMLGHNLLPPELDRSAVALFREPSSRMVSAFDHDRHHFGLNATLSRLIQDVNFEDYMRFPGIAGCYTKMLTHRFCAEAVPLTLSDLRRAENRLRSGMAFVGLTEAWNASVCLFHAQHGGPLRRGEFNAHLRSGHQHTTSKRSSAKVSRSKVTVEKARSHAETLDPYDHIIYAIARATFLDAFNRMGLAVDNGNGANA